RVHEPAVIDSHHGVGLALIGSGVMRQDIDDIAVPDIDRTVIRDRDISRGLCDISLAQHKRARSINAPYPRDALVYLLMRRNFRNSCVLIESDLRVFWSIDDHHR